MPASVALSRERATAFRPVRDLDRRVVVRVPVAVLLRRALIAGALSPELHLSGRCRPCTVPSPKDDEGARRGITTFRSPARPVFRARLHLQDDAHPKLFAGRRHFVVEVVQIWIYSGFAVAQRRFFALFGGTA